MKIAFIRESENKRIRIGVDDGENTVKYSVTRSLYESLGIVKGCEIDEDQLRAIAQDDEAFRAMSRALSVLSYGDKTKSGLYIKLCNSGFSREISRECVLECVRLGYINERRQIERAVLDEANRSLRGRSYIIKKLRSKGYSVNDISEVIDALVDSGELDFSACFERLCDKRGAVSAEDRRALQYKYGYRSDDF